MAEEDQLEQIFLRQAEIQFQTYGHHFSRMTEEEKIMFIKDMVLAASHELHEALDTVGWKGWSESRHLHMDLFMSEMTDVFLMLINLFLVSGVHPSDLASWVAGHAELKQKLNVQRQEQGY